MAEREKRAGGGEQVIPLLQRIHRERRTGRVVFNGRTGRLGHIELSDGEIVAAAGFGMNGEAALPWLCRGMRIHEVSFLEQPVGAKTQPIVDTADFLAKMNAPEVPRAEVQERPVAAPMLNSAPLSIPTTTTPPQARSPLDADTRQILALTLSQYIGPVAFVICENYLTDAQDLESAIKQLAENVPDRERARRFIEDARQELAG